MKFLSIIIVLILTITLLVPQGCTKDVIVDDFMCDDNDRITYDDVRVILRESCGAQSTACHVPAGARPDYTSWNEEMMITLNDELFKNRVVTVQDMPLSPVEPLDSLEFYLIRCWVEGGYLEE